MVLRLWRGRSWKRSCSERPALGDLPRFAQPVLSALPGSLARLFTDGQHRGHGRALVDRPLDLRRDLVRPSGPLVPLLAAIVSDRVASRLFD